MTFRVRLALALGLPLAACKSAPPTTTTPPPATTTTTTTTPIVAAPAAGACPADHVRERLCGLVDADNTFAKAGAGAPHDRCPASAVELDDLEENSIIDGWLLSAHDKSFADLRYDSAHSNGYVVNNGVREGEPRCCYQRCAALPVVATGRTKLPPHLFEYEDCLPKPDTTAHPAATAPQCPAAMQLRLYYADDNPKEPTDAARFVRATDTDCCYMVATKHRCPPNTFETENGGCEEPNPGGRPLRATLADAPAFAPTIARADFADALPAVAAYAAALDLSTRARHAARWARDAAAEHASIAAFVRLARELVAHGAPPPLVRACIAAARDERRHARACYGLASAFAGERLGPGALPPLAPPSPAFADRVVAWFHDGCVNETRAAHALAADARTAPPAIAAVLAPIVDDEFRHAALSAEIVEWAIARDPDAARRIDHALADLGRESDGREPDDRSVGRISDDRAVGRISDGRDSDLELEAA